MTEERIVKPDYFKEYFKKMAQIRMEMDSNGEGGMENADIHAGQVLLYAMASEAKAEAEDANKKADKNNEILEKNPTLMWLLRNKPIQTIGTGVGVWVFLMMLWIVGLIPLFGDLFGVTLPVP